MAEPELVELGSLSEVRIGHYESLMVMVWRGEVTAQSLEKTNAIEARLIERFGKISVIGVITDLTFGVPSPELRRVAAQAMKRFVDGVRGTALVVTAEGVKGVIVKTFLAGLSLVVDFESPLRSHRNMTEALDWVAGHDSGLRATGLGQAIEDFVRQSRPPSGS